jgi:hypothetical protein
MDITVYLPDDLGNWAKENDLGLSRMLRAAVEAEKRRRETVAATLGETATYNLPVYELDGDSGHHELTVRLHGRRVASQPFGEHGEGRIDVYLGQDEKIYIVDFDDVFHRNVEPDDLRNYVDEPTYIAVMRALGKEPVIDVGLPD